MNNTSKLLLSFIGVAVICVGVLLFKHEPAQEETQEETLKGVVPIGVQVDIIGTRSGTSTTPVYFGDNPKTVITLAASTTVAKRIESHANTMTFKIDAILASTTPDGEASFQVHLSDDTQCDTASTTTTISGVVMDEISWYDAAPFQLNVDGSTTIASASTTWLWEGIKTGEGRILAFENVNAKCVRFIANASSTNLYVGMLTRSESYR